jgi:hypothetical protein
VVSWVAVAIPLVTLGFGTPFVVTWAAVRLRSWLLGLAAAGYLASVAVAFAGPDEADWRFSQVIVVCWLIGTGHLLAIRPRLARAGDLAEPVHGADLHMDPAVQAALFRRQRREQARALVASDPLLADELGIGRPDRHRDFDDGGLVDLNRVPATVLAQLPGFTPALADRVVAVREQRGGLLSVDELVVFAGVPPETLAACRERLLVRPESA